LECSRDGRDYPGQMRSRLQGASTWRAPRKPREERPKSALSPPGRLDMGLRACTDSDDQGDCPLQVARSLRIRVNVCHLSTLFSYRGLIGALVARGILKARYRGSVLVFFWS